MTLQYLSPWELGMPCYLCVLWGNQMFIEEEKNTDIKNISDLRFSKYTALFIRLCEHGVINSLLF